MTNIKKYESFVGAYIFVSVGNTDIKLLREELLKIKEVHLVHLIIGPSDMLIYMQASSLSKLRSVLDASIRDYIDKDMILDTRTELILQRKGGGGFNKEAFIPPFGSAWILITLSIGNPEDVVKQLLNIDGIINAHSIIGECDIIAYAETNNLDTLVSILDDDMKNIEGIKNTDTRLVLMKEDKLETRKIVGNDLNI